MIDWISALVPLPHDVLVEDASWQLFSSNGDLVRRSSQPVLVPNSYGQTIRVVTARVGMMQSALHLSGNAAKFLQGHNVFGSNDLCALVTEMARSALTCLNVPFTESDVRRWSAGDFELTRVDIAEHFNVGSPETVATAIRHIGHHGQLSRRGGASTEPGTAYFGKGSDRWSLALYDKRAELDVRGHELAADLPLRDNVLAECEGDIRVELRLQSLELVDQGLRRGSAWLDLNVGELFQHHLAKLSVPPQQLLRDADLAGVSSAVQMAYVAWASGDNLRGRLPEATFRRYRKSLGAFGIDIASPPPVDTWQDVDWMSVFHRGPKPIPAWAVGTSLLACAG